MSYSAVLLLNVQVAVRSRVYNVVLQFLFILLSRC